MWLDYINSTVGPAATRVVNQVVGKCASDQKSLSIAVNELRNALTCIEQHLRLRNFLVGHQLTLADALLVSVVTVCFELVFDKKTRKSTVPNLARYALILLSMPPFQAVFGSVVFCKDAVTPHFTKEEK